MAKPSLVSTGMLSAVVGIVVNTENTSRLDEQLL
jgi:hypothetical protein